MTTLRDVLILVNYKSQEEKIAYVKLLAFRGAFQHLHYSADQFIANTEALDLLNIQFDSLLTGFQWLSAMTDSLFLRKEKANEGIGRAKELSGVNLRRWEQGDAMRLDVIQRSDHETASFQLYECARTLHLLNEYPWPTDQLIQHALFFGGLEKQIKARVCFLPKNFSGTIYYLTGPRGIFNSENEALPEILAQWFRLPDKVDVIKRILDQHSSSQDSMQWNIDLTALKRKIIQALSVNAWPEAQDSHYYHDQTTYDSEAIRSQRELLSCENGPWPVAADMAYYHLKQHFSQEAFDSGQIRFISVVAQGKENQLANSDDTFELWFSRFGKTCFEQNEKVAFVYCNNTHHLPFVETNLRHTACYELAQRQNNVMNNLRGYLSQRDFANPKKGTELIVVGPAAHEFSPAIMLDGLAKTIFSIKKHARDLNAYIQEQCILNQHEPNDKIICYRNIIHYNQHGYFYGLLEQTIYLALLLYRENALIKTSGLFNYAMNVLKKRDGSNQSLLVILCQSIVVNFQRYLEQQSGRIQNYDQIKNIYDGNIKKLQAIRFSLKRDLLSNSITHFYQHCFKQMTTYFLTLLHTSEVLLGKTMTDYAIVYLGSTSRKEATPYSDLEWMILLGQNDANANLIARQLTKIILLMMINLGETPLQWLGITVQDQFHRELPFHGKFYDQDTPTGFSFDANMPGSCKTPLGQKVGENIVFRLIGTPTELANLFTSKETFFENPILLQVLSASKFVAGTSPLYDAYLNGLKVSLRTMMPVYSLLLFKRDHEKFLSLRSKKFDLKIHAYRPLFALLDTLLMPYSIARGISVREKIDLLFQYGVLNPQQSDVLEKAAQLVLFLRAKYHFLFQTCWVNAISEADQRLCERVQAVTGSMFNFFNDVIAKDDYRKFLNEGSARRFFSKNYQAEFAALLCAALNANLAMVRKILTEVSPTICQAFLSRIGFATITHLNIVRRGAPLQLALYAHDEEMVALIKRHMDPAEFQRQCESVFGLDYNTFMASQLRDATRLCSELENAFRTASTTDVTNALRHIDNTTSVLQDVLNRFEKNLKQYVRENSAHNPYILQCLFEIFDRLPYDWNKECLLSQQPIGLMEKLSSAVWLQHLAQGIYNLGENNFSSTPIRSFLTQNSPRLDVRSLDRLGVDFCVDIFGDAARDNELGCCEADAGRRLTVAIKFMSNKTTSFQSLLHSERNRLTAV